MDRWRRPMTICPAKKISSVSSRKMQNWSSPMLVSYSSNKTGKKADSECILTVKSKSYERNETAMKSKSEQLLEIPH